MKRDMQADKKIINFLLDRAGEKVYLSQIAVALKIAPSTAHQILNRYVKSGLVKSEKMGNLTLFEIKAGDPLIKQLKVTKTMELLGPLIEKLKPVSDQIVLFGSAGKGENTQESDLDLFILANKTGKIEEVINNYSKEKLKVMIKTYPEWVTMQKRNPYLYDQINQGRVLWEKNE